jgi:hypothetical protein
VLQTDKGRPDGINSHGARNNYRGDQAETNAGIETTYGEPGSGNAEGIHASYERLDVIREAIETPLGRLISKCMRVLEQLRDRDLRPFAQV